MRTPIRVLIVDDSLLMRSILRDLLSKQEDIEIVASASNGESAIDAVNKLSPDVVVMDLHMPKLDGLSATKSIMTSSPNPPAIIVFSALTRSDATLVLDCMDAGAFSCVHKPEGEANETAESVVLALSEEIRLASTCNRSALQRSAVAPKIKKTTGNQMTVVVIGSSTGGPPVVHNLFANLHQENIAYIIVQHMPPAFTGGFAKRLDRVSDIKVSEAETGDILKPGTALVVPGDYHLTVNKDLSINLNQDPPVHALRPAIDVTMQSVATINYPSVIGIILTGMGEDGAVGMKALKDADAHTIVQDPETCVVDGMVQAALKKQCVDKVVTPEHIPSVIHSLLSDVSE